MSVTATTAETAKPLAVLVSGGLDSAILLAEVTRQHPAVFPLYLRFGLAWEGAEQAHLARFLAAIAVPSLRPLTCLDMPVRDLYGRHWSTTGQNVPDADSADEAVFLPGRNVLLLAKAILWCHLNDVPAIALAPLESNPFPDATAGFFREFEAVVNRAVVGGVKVVRPFANLSKVDVLRRGAGFPLQWTFSCIRPIHGRHCGACNKCAERQKGFRDADLPDPTPYEWSQPCSA